MNKNNYILQGFQEGVDYNVKKGEKKEEYIFHNGKLAKNFLRNWQEEGFFKNVSQTTPTSLSSSNISDKNSSQIEDKKNNYEEVFYGWREEFPLGKKTGEWNSDIYHEKAWGEVFPDMNSNELSQEINKEDQVQQNKDNNQKYIIGVSLITFLVLLGMVIKKSF